MTARHSPLTNAGAGRGPAFASLRDVSFAPLGDVFPSPTDWRDQVLYELMIDRFDDNQDHPAYDPAKAKRGDALRPPRLRDPAEGERFQGGTLKGITRRLDYLHNLGATAIWISPPLKNRPGDEKSYHGYGTQDYLQIDPRFGTLEDMQELVRECHARGMYMIQDVVFDHVGDVFAYEDDADVVWQGGRRFPLGYWRAGHGGGPAGDRIGPDDAVWPIELQRPDAFKRMGRMRDVGASRGDEATDGDFQTLKVLDLENPAVMAAVIHIHRYWIGATDVDGFRLDAARHVRPQAMRTFCNAVREYATSIGKKNFLMIGEVAGDNDLMIKYVGMNTPLPEEHGQAGYPQLDATLDFTLYKTLPWTIKGWQDPQALRERFDFLRRHYRDYGRAGGNYVTFFENHDGGQGDRHRLLHGGVDPKLAVLASGFLLTSLGIPCLYYGTEQGFDGGGFESDVFIRECMFGGNWGAFGTRGMHFFNPDHPIYQAIAKIAAVRRETPALRYGRQYFREMSVDGVSFFQPWDGKSTLAWSRILDVEEMIIAQNLDAVRRNDYVTVDAMLTPPGTVMMDLLGNLPPLVVEARADGWGFIRIPLEAHEMAILRPKGAGIGDRPRTYRGMGGAEALPPSVPQPQIRPEPRVDPAGMPGSR